MTPIMACRSRVLGKMYEKRNSIWTYWRCRTISMEEQRSTTIYALSSGQGKCAVAIIRISGSRASEAIKKMTNLSALNPKTIYLRKIYDPITKELIDRGLCLWFPEPKSFTGEDTVEFHVHGGKAVVLSLMSALSKLNFRLAQPGEFTRRSFNNNKLDLTEIEGLADLIDAETEQQRKQALIQADGCLRKLYDSWRESLTDILAHLEAFIDFSEEENIEDQLLERCNVRLKELTRDIMKHLCDDRRGEILREGVKTVFIGKPNVGKSSLLNKIVQREAAIVTPIAGTTRDIIELRYDISGFPIILLDTAGLSTNSNDLIEQEGIRRARLEAEKADFVIIVVNALEFQVSGKPYEEFTRVYIEELGLTGLLELDKMKNYMIVFNKTDLVDERTKNYLKEKNIVNISCVREEDGFLKFLDVMTNKLEGICGNPSRENPTISQSRHRVHLTNCVNHINEYLKISSGFHYDTVIAVEEIRKAIREIGRITGSVNTEEILNIIFRSFCIGK